MTDFSMSHEAIRAFWGDHPDLEIRRARRPANACWRCDQRTVHARGNGDPCSADLCLVCCRELRGAQSATA